jgi:hypothetical protein
VSPHVEIIAGRGFHFDELDLLIRVQTGDLGSGGAGASYKLQHDENEKREAIAHR